MDIIKLLRNSAVQNPDANAISAPGRSSLSYRALLDQIDYVRSALHAMGIGPNDRIAIALANGPEMAVCFLAIAISAIAAPLNPAYRSKEFDFYLSVLNAKALLIQADIAEPARSAAQSINIPIIELQTEANRPAGVFSLDATSTSLAVSHSRHQQQTNDVALVLPTSGTTSQPKIVPLSHKNLCSSAYSVKKSLALTEKDCCLNMMPLFHIHGLIGTLLSSLSAGASIICCPGFSVPGFFESLSKLKPSWYSAVPTMHQAILADVLDHKDQTTTHSLRFIRSSSAALGPQVLAGLESMFNIPVIEAYGMTEASHQITSNPLPAAVRKPGSVGIAAGPEIRVMNETDQFCSPGEIGEIVIHGENVTPGYENNSAANETAFTGAWFYTGDQGYLDQDAYLFITGRLNEIVNRGGEKISPREIDETLLMHPEIIEAVAFAVPHNTLGEDIAVAVIVKQGSSLTLAEIREFAFQHLSDSKVPSEILIVDDIPKGPTGKSQRLSLSEKLANLRHSTYVEPRTNIEQLVADIWVDVLTMSQAGIHDNFFMLGGDSIQATQIVFQLQKYFQIDLPITIIFMKPTIFEVTQAVTELLNLDEIESIS